jgi:hypothetical protein
MNTGRGPRAGPFILVPVLTPSDAATAANFPNRRVLGVTDNGNPVGGQPVDLYAYFTGSVASNCAAYVGTGGVFTPVSGNIVVHDEP